MCIRWGRRPVLAQSSCNCHPLLPSVVGNVAGTLPSCRRVECQRGLEAVAGWELAPKALSNQQMQIPGHTPCLMLLSGLSCFVFCSYWQDFAFTLTPNLLLNALLLRMITRKSSCGLEDICTNLISLRTGFLHISASFNSTRCMWGECLIRDEMTFHRACKTNVSRLEITWTSVSNPVGRTCVAHSRVRVLLVAGSLPPCPWGKAPIPTYLIFFFFALCQIFFVLF